VINCFLLTFLDPFDKGNVGSLHRSHTHTDHVPRFTFAMVEPANFREYMEEVRREVEEMSEMKRYLRASQSHTEIVTQITPLIVEDTHQRMLQAVEKFQGLERRWSLKLQELDKGEATQRQWSSQLEKLTATTTALEVARKEAEDRAEARVTAEVDTLQKDVRLA
jgi:KaiC/GvpD/RAD55 family RecA-like ATPase